MDAAHRFAQLNEDLITIADVIVVPPRTAIQKISAEAADPYRASLLRTPVSAPLIRLTRLLHDRNDRPVQHLKVHVSPDRSRILMDISADQIDTLAAGHVAHDPKLLAPRGR